MFLQIIQTICDVVIAGAAVKYMKPELQKFQKENFKLKQKDQKTCEVEKTKIFETIEEEKKNGYHYVDCLPAEEEWKAVLVFEKTIKK